MSRDVYLGDQTIKSCVEVIAIKLRRCLEEGLVLGFPGGSDGTESACNARDQRSIPGLGKIPWRREWLPTPGFLPGEFHGESSLVGYGPWGCKESDTTQQLTLGYVRMKNTRCVV